MESRQGEVFVLAFESTHAALAAHATLASANPALIPTPREISAGCGMALRFQSSGAQAAQRMVAAARIDEGLSALYEYVQGEVGYLPVG